MMQELGCAARAVHVAAERARVGNATLALWLLGKDLMVSYKPVQVEDEVGGGFGGNMAI
jgi:hypothetical protein